MGKGPVFYSDMDRKARDLLYEDHMSDHKVTITSHTATGLEVASTVTNKVEAILVGFGTQLKNEKITTNVKLDANPNNNFQLSSSVTVDELAPGLKTILNFIIPDHRSGKVELQYQNKCAAISTSLRMTANPIVNFSGVFGTNYMGVGIDLSFDTASGSFTKHNAGVFVCGNDEISTVSLTLNNKGDNITASCYLNMSRQTVCAECCMNLLSTEMTFTIGLQRVFNPITLMKVRGNNHGRVSGLIQHDWNPRTRFTLSGEVNTRIIDRSVKVGLALALKP